jgi:hypothetical protein
MAKKNYHQVASYSLTIVDNLPLQPLQLSFLHHLPTMYSRLSYLQASLAGRLPSFVPGRRRSSGEEGQRRVCGRVERRDRLRFLCRREHPSCLKWTGERNKGYRDHSFGFQRKNYLYGVHGEELRRHCRRTRKFEDVRRKLCI